MKKFRVKSVLLKATDYVEIHFSQVNKRANLIGVAVALLISSPDSHSQINSFKLEQAVYTGFSNRPIENEILIGSLLGASYSFGIDRKSRIGIRAEAGLEWPFSFPNRVGIAYHRAGIGSFWLQSSLVPFKPGVEMSIPLRRKIKFLRVCRREIFLQGSFCGAQGTLSPQPENYAVRLGIRKVGMCTMDDPPRGPRGGWDFEF